MPRLFIAIDIPDEIKRDLARLAGELPGARWVPAGQLHLTLRFLGETGPQEFAAVKGALSGFRFRGFPLALCGAGHFPPGKYPRVLWVGVAPGGGLGELQQELELVLVGAGMAPEERPFAPHLTLARLKETPLASVTAFESRHARLSYPPFEVREIILYSSVLSGQGAVHHPELVLPCREDAPRR